MNDDDRSAVSGFTISLICGIVLLLAYVLSPIPVYLLLYFAGFEDNEWVQSATETIYTPISWAADNSQTVNGFYEYQGQLCEQLGIVP